MKGLLAVNAIPRTSWEALFYVLFPDETDASSILRTDSLSKSLHRSCQKGTLPYKIHISLTLCHLVFKLNYLQFHKKEPSSVKTQKCFISSEQRSYSCTEVTKNLCIPWPISRKSGESNKSIGPLDHTVWGSKAGKQEKLLLNAGIKLPTINLSNMVMVSSSCAKINGRNWQNNIYEVAL